MTKSGFAAGQLKSLVERIERAEEEKSALTKDISEIYSEAKGHRYKVTCEACLKAAKDGGF